MKPKRILVIDDDKGLTEMVKLNLEATEHFEVCIENLSRLAVATARRFNPDLVLLDYVMPGMDGGDVAAAFRKDPFLAKVPIIMVTALVANQEMGPNGTVVCGGQVMLAKPVKMENLLKAIEAQLLSVA